MVVGLCSRSFLQHSNKQQKAYLYEDRVTKHVIFERLNTIMFLESTIWLSEKYGGGLKKSSINIRLISDLEKPSHKKLL